MDRIKLKHNDAGFTVAACTELRVFTRMGLTQFQATVVAMFALKKKGGKAVIHLTAYFFPQSFCNVSVNVYNDNNTYLKCGRLHPTFSIASLSKFGSIIGARSAVSSLARE